MFFPPDLQLWSFVPAAAVVVVYIVTTCFLTRCPGLIHGDAVPGRIAARATGRSNDTRKKKGGKRKDEKAEAGIRHVRSRFSVQHQSHRGCIGEAGLIENTLPAFRHAVQASTELIELDVWLTKDEQVVVFHDTTLTRLAGVDSRVTDYNYDELPTLRQGDVQERIPLLSEVFTVVPPTTVVLVEFKQNNNVLIEKVHEVITKSDRKASVLWYSLDHSANVKLRRFDPSIPQVASTWSMFRLSFLYHTGLLALLNHNAALHEDVFLAFCVELDYDYFTRYTKWPHWQKVLLAFLLQGRPSYLLAPPDLIAHLRKRGVPTWLVGINDEDDLQRASEVGATGVMTDRPLWLSTCRRKDGRLDLPALS